MDDDARDPAGSATGPAAVDRADAPDGPDDGHPPDPIEPESVDPEHAAFVLLGVVLTLVLVASVL